MRLHLAYSKLLYLNCLFGVASAIALTNTLKPSSLSAYVLMSLWLSAPSLFLVLLDFKERLSFHLGPRGALLLSIIVVVGGIFDLVDVIYLNPNPQGDIPAMMLPLFELFGMILSFALIKFGAKVKKYLNNEE